jgi:hypothetical protein
MSSSKKLTRQGILRLVFIRVYRLNIQQSVMLLFSTQLCPSNLLSVSPPPSLLPCVKVHYIQTVYGWEGEGVLSCVGDHMHSAGV